MTQPLYTLRQLAYVVRDLDSALKYWTEVLKVGPFFKLEHLALFNAVLLTTALDHCVHQNNPLS